MTKFDRADYDKVDAAVFDLVQRTIEHGKERACFEFSALFASLKLSRMDRKKFALALMDVPSGSSFCKEYGDWVISEVGDDLYVLIKLGDRESPWFDHPDYFQPNYERPIVVEARARLERGERVNMSKVTPNREQREHTVANLVLPAGMSADDAQKILAFATQLQSKGRADC